MSDEDLDRVSKLLGLDKVLAKNNANYHSQVGREFDGSGIQMSEGEQQKLGLARVFAGEFGLLILDEPTASLDPLAEYELNRLILDKAKTTTTILISHRLSSVRDADRIILLANGEIAEGGTHDELIALHGRYFEMFEKQASGYIDRERF